MTTISLLGEAADIHTRSNELTAASIEDDYIDLEYLLMAGTLPKDNGALVAMWRNRDQIPWDEDPVAKTEITTNDSSGTASFDGLSRQENSYIFALLAAPMAEDTQKARNAVVSLYVPREKEESVQYRDQLKLAQADTNTVKVQFEALAGYRAKTNKAWMGLWTGDSVYPNIPPKYKEAIDADSSSGTVRFKNLSLKNKWSYTVGMFASGWAVEPSTNALACSLTFTLT